MTNPRRILGIALLFAGVIATDAPTALAQQGQELRGASPARGKGNAKGFTQKQLDNMQARIETTKAILSRLEGQAKAQGRLSNWRQSTLESLLMLPLRALQQVESNAHSVDALAVSIREAAEDPNLLGDPSHDLVYTPITPCRYIDTRVGPKVSPASPRSYDFMFTGAFYGGSGSCGMAQDTVAAIAMNVTITEPVGAPAFLAVKPTLAAPTTSFMNWYEGGNHVQLANAGVVTVDQSVFTDPEFFIVVSESTHVIVDFFGFFAEPQATPLDCFTVNNAVVVANNAQISFPPGLIASCPAGYDLAGGGNLYTGNNAGFWWWLSQPSGQSWITAGRNETGASATVAVYAQCCRVPGRP